MRIPDNYDLWEAHDREQARQAMRYPYCVKCGQAIEEDDLFNVFGDLYHVECGEEEFKKPTGDYIE